MRLTDLFTGRLSWRELDVLIQRLPAESFTQTAIRDELTDEQLDQMASRPDSPHGQWSKTDLLLALVADSIAWLTHVQISKTGTKTDPPKPIRRPGVGRQKRVDPRAVTYLQQIRERNQQRGV